MKKAGRQTIILMPYEQTIAQNDTVRVLERIMNGIDIAQIRRGKVTTRTMLKIIVYGYMEGITSLRRIAKACSRDVNFKWLLETEPVPSKSVIGSFIQDNGELIESIFNQVVNQLYKINEINGESVYIDGTKIEANANKYSFVWRKAVEKNNSNLENRINELLIEINAVYSTDFNKENLYLCIEFLEKEREKHHIEFVHGKGKRKSLLQREYEQLTSFIQRKDKYTDYTTKFKGRNSFAKTDTDATFMHMKEDHMRNAQLKPAYNMQIAVDSEYIVGMDVSSQRSDQLTLIPMLKKLKNSLTYKYTNIVADAGYESEENYKYLQENKQISYIKPQNYEKSKKRSYKKWIGKRENMKYDKVKDEYICAKSRKLSYQFSKTRISKSGFKSQVKVYECANCDRCGYKKRCKKSNYNKRLYISTNFVEYRKISLDNITNDKGIILRINRSIQVEGAFGVLKQDYGFRRLSRRGNYNVKTEFALFCLAYNINKYCNKLKKNRLGFHYHLPDTG